MIRDIVLSLPREWRCTVVVERPTQGQYGYPGTPQLHTVADCLVAARRSDEDVAARTYDPETVAWLHAPVGADFASTDTVVVPGPAGTEQELADGTTLQGSGKTIRPWGRFRVTGEPDWTPLGVAVPLGRA